MEITKKELNLIIREEMANVIREAFDSEVSPEEALRRLLQDLGEEEQVRKLDFTTESVNGDEIIRYLIENSNDPKFSNLEELGLRESGVSSDGALALSGSDLFKSLYRLDLESNDIGCDGLKALVAGWISLNRGDDESYLYLADNQCKDLPVLQKMILDAKKEKQIYILYGTNRR